MRRLPNVVTRGFRINGRQITRARRFCNDACKMRAERRKNRILQSSANSASVASGNSFFGVSPVCPFNALTPENDHGHLKKVRIIARPRAADYDAPPGRTHQKRTKSLRGDLLITKNTNSFPIPPEPEKNVKKQKN